jgi:hypothetical protein
MDGIVLWSDEPGQRLLIWCEDQGGLAFYDGTQARPAATATAGDLVHVEVPGTGPLRRARDVQLLKPGGAAMARYLLLREAARTQP